MMALTGRMVCAGARGDGHRVAVPDRRSLDPPRSGTWPMLAAVVAGASLSWSGPLAAGESATVTYSVRVDAHPRGDSTLLNVVAIDPSLPTLALDGGEGSDSATTATPIRAMAYTGAGLPIAVIVFALLLLSAGAVLIIVRRKARRSAE